MLLWKQTIALYYGRDWDFLSERGTKSTKQLVCLLSASLPNCYQSDDFTDASELVERTPFPTKGKLVFGGSVNKANYLFLPSFQIHIVSLLIKMKIDRVCQDSQTYEYLLSKIHKKYFL